MNGNNSGVAKLNPVSTCKKTSCTFSAIQSILTTLVFCRAQLPSKALHTRTTYAHDIIMEDGSSILRSWIGRMKVSWKVEACPINQDSYMPRKAASSIRCLVPEYFNATSYTHQQWGLFGQVTQAARVLGSKLPNSSDGKADLDQMSFLGFHTPTPLGGNVVIGRKWQ